MTTIGRSARSARRCSTSAAMRASISAGPSRQHLRRAFGHRRREPPAHERAALAISGCLWLRARSRPKIVDFARMGCRIGVLEVLIWHAGAEACWGCRLRGQPRGAADVNASDRRVRLPVVALKNCTTNAPGAAGQFSTTPTRPASPPPPFGLFGRVRAERALRLRGRVRSTASTARCVDASAGHVQSRPDLERPFCSAENNRRLGGGVVGGAGVVGNCSAVPGALVVQFPKATTGNRTRRTVAFTPAATRGCPRSRQPLHASAPSRPPCPLPGPYSPDFFASASRCAFEIVSTTR